MIERKKFLELCQKYAVDRMTFVEFGKAKCYPLALRLWFDARGDVHNSAHLRFCDSRTDVYAELKDVSEEKRDFIQ